MTTDGLDLRVSGDPARAMAEAFVDWARRNLPATIAVSGGSTPRPFYERLAGAYREALDWRQLTLFQVDERCVPPADAASNWRMLRETLLDRLPIRGNRMKAEQPAGAEAYELALRQSVPANHAGVPVLDLVLLGMGADGHTASLFPGSPALEARDRAVVPTPAAGKEDRLTLTLPVLQAARARWFLVTGADKAPALARTAKGEPPAGRVGPAAWFVDEAAAGLVAD